MVGGLVRTAIDSGKPMSELTDSELDGIPGNARQAVRRGLEKGQTIESKVSLGGTASGPLAAQLERAREALHALRA
jgi:argininosuccinate lyase